MPNPLRFKGDPAPKKRKRTHPHQNPNNPSSELAQDPHTTTTTTTAEDPPDDTTWLPVTSLTDLSTSSGGGPGPLLLTLPTSPSPITLSADAHGAVFVQRVENMIDNLLETAEPHDVRQVWVGSRVAGSGKFSFKGWNGGYLGCDGVGVLGAGAEAVGAEEGWDVVEVDGGEGEGRGDEGREGGGVRFGLRSSRGGFLGFEQKGEGGDGGKVVVRGDRDGEGAAKVGMKMQAKFKPRVKRERKEKEGRKVSRREMEGDVGRRLGEGEVRILKKARREGGYREAVLDVKVRGSHDKFA